MPNHGDEFEPFVPAECYLDEEVRSKWLKPTHRRRALAVTWGTAPKGTAERHAEANRMYTVCILRHQISI